MKNGFRAACVMGWPVRHSRSPMMHNYWIRKHDLNAEYRHAEVRPEDFPAFVSDLPGNGYVGGNVTMPHKAMALKIAEADDKARAIGAVNTLWVDNGRLRGTNTDGDGFVKNLDASTPGWDQNLKDALVLGAGGAARSIVYALLARDIERIHVVNRTASRADEFRRDFGDRIHSAEWDSLPGLLKGAGLVINTTPLGNKGNPPLEIDFSPLADNAVVADINYVPLVTTVLAAAKKRGLRTADGVGMLLHQATRGFSLWFGVTPEVTDELRDLILADVNKK